MLDLRQNSVCSHLTCPTDMIICASSGKTKQEHKTFADRFFAFCEHVKRCNEGIHQHNSLFYILETLPSDHLDFKKYSYCTCDSRADNDCKRTFICNWPLAADSSTIGGIRFAPLGRDVNDLEVALGFSPHYATRSGMFMPFCIE